MLAEAERRIEYMPLGELLEAAANPKAHDERGIAASVGRFGFVDPLVLDERTGRLISGHGRLAVLRQAEAAGDEPPEGVVAGPAGWEVPVGRGWASADDNEARAALVAVNQLIPAGGWEREDLGQLLDSLEDLSGTGYEADDLAALLRAVSDRSTSTVENSRSERLARYTEKETRSIVLDYAPDTFARVVAVAERVRGRLHVKSNADLFLSLLEEP